MDAEMLRRAEESLARLGEAFVTDGTAAMIALEEKILDRPEYDAWRDDALHALHILKGQGGTFGYPFVTRMAGVGCGIARRSGGPVSGDEDLLKQIIRILRTTLERRVAGDGGPSGRLLADRIEAAAAIPRDE